MKYILVMLSLAISMVSLAQVDTISQASLKTVFQIEKKVHKVIGDFNGDGKRETMWVAKPITKGMGSCARECLCEIRFSDPTIPTIVVRNSIGGVPVNEGDLNGDGTDEIGILPDWFTSCWRDYFVYTLKNGKWVYAVDPILTHCNQWEKGYKPIRKDTHIKGNVLITYTEMDKSFSIKRKSIPIK